MHVSDILSTKDGAVLSVRDTDSIAVACRSLTENRIGALVVLDAASKVVGILSERDIVRGLSEQREKVLTLQVKDLMTGRIYVCKPQDLIKDVMGWMTDRRIRHLPVVQDGALIGIVSIGDVVKHRLTEVQTEANVLRDIAIARH